MSPFFQPRKNNNPGLKLNQRQIEQDIFNTRSYGLLTTEQQKNIHAFVKYRFSYSLEVKRIDSALSLDQLNLDQQPAIIIQDKNHYLYGYKEGKHWGMTPLDSVEFRNVNTDVNELTLSHTDNLYQPIVAKKAHQPNPPEFDYVSLVKQRGQLLKSVARFDEQLNDINPAIFKYLMDEQRVALAQDLYFAFYLFYANYNLDLKEERYQSLAFRGAQIKKCAKLLNLLRASTDINNPEQQRELVFDDSEKPVKYLGLTILAPILSEVIENTVSGKKAIEVMTNINGVRLYWVWAKAFIGSAFSFINATDAQNNLGLPYPYTITGYMSWVLYAARFGINLYFLIKHSRGTNQLTDEEKQLTADERFLNQWNQRKFSLINDSIWGLANLACFFWLVGDGMLGWWGNVATAVLLLMDVCVSIWAWREAEAGYVADLERLSQDISSISSKIKEYYPNYTDENLTLEQQLKHATAYFNQQKATSNEPQKLSQLEEQQSQCYILIHQRQQAIKEHQNLINRWNFEVEGLMYDFAYAVLLLVAFVALCSFLFPPTAMPAVLAANGALISGIGAACCFAFNAIWSSFKNNIQVKQTLQTQEGYELNYKNELANFNHLKTQLDQEQDSIKSEQLLKQSYLNICLAYARSNQQRDLLIYQKTNVMHSTMMGLIAPPIIFSCLVFLPFGVNFAVIAVSLAVLKLSNWMFNTPPQSVLNVEINVYAAKPAESKNNAIALYLDDTNTVCFQNQYESSNLDDELLSPFAEEIKNKIQQGQQLNEELKQHIIWVINQQGYDFSLPTFDQEEFDKFKNKTDSERLKFLNMKFPQATSSIFSLEPKQVTNTSQPTPKLS